ARNRQIVLGDLELVEEAVLENIHLIEVDLAPQLGAVVAVIPELENRVLAQLGVETVQAGREARRNRKRLGRRQSRDARRQGSVAEQRTARREEVRVGRQI